MGVKRGFDRNKIRDGHYQFRYNAVGLRGMANGNEGGKWSLKGEGEG